MKKHLISTLIVFALVFGVLIFMAILVLPLAMCSITRNWIWIILYLPILSLLIYLTNE